ncbi:hypothetical protein QEZ40_002728 [Streptomyces katrae]|uniref:Uncharacterized protein n=1 Tax=Streptomyces katrae TaxID=68223 RepID=A0ABT7GW11_9ACTN|nr:hypothetical protein [Streptomyces katrae]MDK9497784.1 hypothetical protein [Streptomyces katrae]
MADHIPINPCTIPQFTGDLDALEQDRTAIAAAASSLRDTGANIDSTFQGLAAFYSAPEAAQLFATTNRVRTESDHFADQLETAAQALGEFAVEARPIVARLKQLQSQATAFTNKIQGDAHWKDDGKKVDENNDLIHDVNAAAEAFWAAERTCASKIRALYGLPALTADDGTHADGMYGYRAADLNKVQDLPWGSQLAQSHRWYDIGHWTKSFLWDGLVMDGIVGTVRGLGTLVGADGSAAAGQAWTGLAKLATGIALTTNPGTAFVLWNTDAKAMPAWFRDSRNTMKETGKALVAWDEWGKNPARAAGGVTFNVLTTVFSGGVGTGVKTGAIAKTISVAGKAGRLIDPMTYVGQAAGKAASLTFTKLKIGELLANIGKTDGAFPKVDDVAWTNLPKADTPGVTFPHPNDTARLPDDALGRPQYLDKVTHQLLDHNARPKHDLTATPKGPDHPLAEAPTRQEATVGAHAHAPGGTADNMPHNSHTEPGGAGTGGHGATDTDPTGGGSSSSHTDTPSTGSHADGPGAGGGHSDNPTVPHQDGGGTMSADPGGLNAPSHALSPDERVALDSHLGDVERRYSDDFDELKHDPDHKGQVAPSEMDEARLALDLRERGLLPADIQRPPGANQGDLYSPGSGMFYDIKGVHSDWPPFNTQLDKSMPFKNAYDPDNNQVWVNTLIKQIVKRRRTVILDTRNANQAAIDDLKAIVEQHGWSDRVVWYP